MKIEMGESLIFSYLKHCEGCRIVQSNWKHSNVWTTLEYNKKRAKDLFDKIVNTNEFRNIFKDVTFDQLIKQAEIDLLGINPAENSIFAIDVAFHNQGLNYGSNDETAFKVLSKILKAIFIMIINFDDYSKMYSYFVTPKTNPAPKNTIEELIKKANNIIEDQAITIKFITNEDFFDEILDPVIQKTKSEEDSSELFIRAIKMLQLDNRENTIIKTINKIEKNPKFVSDKTEINGMKIGQFVKDSFRKIYVQNILSTDELNKLQEKKYVKEIFNSNFPILLHKTESPIDKNGKNRYYAGELFFGEYYLTSQWFESQWQYLLKWLEKIGYDYNINNK